MASGRSWMPRWPYAGALAHQATRKAGGRRRGFARLLHDNSARFADAMPEPPYRRRTPAPHHQGLVDSSGRGAGWTARDPYSNGPEDEERNATRLGNKPDSGQS